MATYGKVTPIIEHFGIEDLDDATLRMGEILCHYKQEKLPRPESFPNPESVEDEVLDRLQAGEYQRPVVHCKHFAYLLKQIGESFGHECEVVEARPEYLERSDRTFSKHFLVHDTTLGRYRDSSIYRGIIKNGRMIPIAQSGVDRNDVPEDLLHIVG